MRLDDFLALRGRERLEAVAEQACFITERSGEHHSSVYYKLDGFYVEMIFLHHPDPRLVLIAFTEKDEQFEGLVNALPVDPGELLRAA